MGREELFFSQIKNEVKGGGIVGWDIDGWDLCNCKNDIEIIEV